MTNPTNLKHNAPLVQLTRPFGFITPKNMKEKVASYLKKINVGKTPTEIGMALGKDYNSASSSVSKSLKKLVEDGLVSKMKIDKKVLYRWIR